MTLPGAGTIVIVDNYRNTLRFHIGLLRNFTVFCAGG